MSAQNNIINLYNTASAYQKRLQFSKAKELFLSILEEKTEKHLEGGVYLHLGCIERRLGNEQQAQTCFKKCLENIPDHKKAGIYSSMTGAGNRQLSPISNCYGFDRGTPIDRYYIDNFIDRFSICIHGTVMEIKDDFYTVTFGGDNVKSHDILDIDSGNKRATIYADLRNTKSFLKEIYDCIIITQTVQLIDDTRSVIASLYKLLKPGGVVLASFSSVNRIDSGLIPDHWRFTTGSATHSFLQHFNKDKVQVFSNGNVFVCSSFLYGRATEELTKEELDYNDPYFPLVITLKAAK